MKIGVYAGSFNPFHLGHYHIYTQAKAQFDLVVLAIGKNLEKANNNVENFIPQQRAIQYVSYYDSLLTDELKRIAKNWGDDVTLIRGLRNLHDLNAEQNMRSFLTRMYPELKVVYFLCEPQYQHISSSALREIRKFSEEEFQKYIVK